MTEPKNNIEEKRTFGLTNLAVDNKVSVYFLTFMFILFGFFTYVTMPKEAYPEIVFPQMFINTVYFGNSAEDIESLISRPLEKELNAISEIKKVTSSSMQDYSLIVTEFPSDVDLEVAKQKIKDAVDKAKSELPNDLTQDPEIIEVNFSEIPIMVVNISGDFPNEVLKSYADILQDRIEDLDEVSEAAIKGAKEREVQINVNLMKMEATQTSYDDIANAFRAENITMSGGEVVANDFRRTVRIVGEFENVKDMENLIIKSENENPIYLRDIATVKFDYQEPTSIARSDMLPVISLDIIKEKGENVLDAADKVKAIATDAQDNLVPEGMKISIFNDISNQTRDTISNLENSIISGVILVVLVLLFFLGLGNSLFVGLAIPLSMLMGFMLVNILDYSLNMVVQFSMILALGMLVDNAIVVVENIYRYIQNGYSGIEAAKLGTGEVALPIIASTATTVAAFLPLAFWPGLMGEFMKYLPITLILVLGSSLFVALVINPVFTSTFMKVTKRAEDSATQRRRIMNTIIFTVVLICVAIACHFADIIWARNIFIITVGLNILYQIFLRPASFFFQDKVLPFIEKVYNRFISAALYKFVPVLIFVGTFGLLIFSMGLLGSNMPKVEFFPSADPLYVNVFVEMPMGNDIEATNKVMKQIEEKVEKAVEPNKDIVEAILAQIGENTSDPNSPPTFGASPHRARLTVAFVPYVERGGKSTYDVMEDIRASVQDIAGAQIVVDRDANGPPVGKPINIEITGDDIDELALLSEDIIKFINDQNIGGVEELQADVKIGKPEMTVNINREAARRYGVSTYAIADGIRTSIFGKEVSKFKEDEEEYPIQVRAAESTRNNMTSILNQKVTFRNPANGRISQVPIASVADIDYASTFSSINRKDKERVITVFSNVLENDGYNANEVVSEIKDVMEEYKMPVGYKYKFTGEQEEQAKEMEFLSTAFMLAIFMIFLIIVAQFNSIISPFIIILSILFSTIGVLFGYVFSGMDIVVIMTGIGIISLAGIVVNNAIVLVDYINLVVKRKRLAMGYENMSQLSHEEIKDAIIQGGETRLRPVLLTAITTVLGLLPLAMALNINFFTLITEFDPQIYFGGDSASFWGVMAWTVIYGLVFSTFLTLIVVPVMYWLAYRMKTLISR